MFTPVRRILQFILIAFSVAWAMMIFTRNAGASAHHTILLWPLPTMLVAIAFAEAP